MKSGVRDVHRFFLCGRRTAIRRIALDLGNGVGKGRQQGGEIFQRRFLAARQVDDQALVANAGNSTGQHGVRGLFQAFGSHRLRHAGYFTVEHGAGGFGRHVTGGDPGTAGGDDQVNPLLVDIIEQRLLNSLNLIRHDSARRNRIVAGA